MFAHKETYNILLPRKKLQQRCAPGGNWQHAGTKKKKLHQACGPEENTENMKMQQPGSTEDNLQ